MFQLKFPELPEFEVVEQFHVEQFHNGLFRIEQVKPDRVNIQFRFVSQQRFILVFFDLFVVVPVNLILVQPRQELDVQQFQLLVVVLVFSVVFLFLFLFIFPFFCFHLLKILPFFLFPVF